MVDQGMAVLLLAVSVRLGRLLSRGGVCKAVLVSGLLTTSVSALANVDLLASNCQDASSALSARCATVAEISVERVDVLSVLSGGMLAPKIAYKDFFKFLRGNLNGLTKSGGTVKTKYVFSGPHFIQLYSHSSRVRAGKADAFSKATRRKCIRTMRSFIDPFLAAHPQGRVVLGGHSYGTVEMQCLKELVEEKYGKQTVAAAYALGAVVRKTDKDVLVITGRHDFMVPLGDFLFAGKAVKGTKVSVPGLDHFMVQQSPEARRLLAEYFKSRSSQSQDCVDNAGINSHD